MAVAIIGRLRQRPQAALAELRVGLFLPEGYPLMTLSLVIETLRIANGIAEGNPFTYVLISETGEPVASSCAFPAPVCHSIHEHPPVDVLLVCAGAQSVNFCSKPVFAWLRQHYQAGIVVGGISSGAFLLARAGLLDGRTSAVHWETIDAMREAFGNVTVTGDIFCIDGRIITCAGGIAALDLTLHLVEQSHGAHFSRQLADLLIYPSVRRGHEPARVNLQARTGITNPLVLRAISLMESNLETPIKVSDICLELDTTPRFLERVFERVLHTTPSQYYMRLRLQEAKGLLVQTDIPVVEVALRCGFSNPSHFTKRFRDAYNVPPSDHRRSHV